MHREIVVSSLRPTTSDGQKYNAFLAVAGYERRARFIAETIRPSAQRRVALGFADQKVLAFEGNRKWYAAGSFEYHELSDEGFQPMIETLLHEIDAGDESVALCVDISSLSRLRMACIVAALMQYQNQRTISVDFLYAVARYSPPADKSEPIPFARAVLPFFAGWSTRLDLPTVAVVGLGYEPDKAVGAYEYLEATRVWVFVPSGEDQRYDNAVRKANAHLLSRLPPEQIISYPVDQPFSSFQSLESVAFGAKSSGRVVLVPFGPKLFALSCLLVGCIHRDVAIWRISAGKYAQPINRRASGKIVGLRSIPFK